MNIGKSGEKRFPEPPKGEADSPSPNTYEEPKAKRFASKNSAKYSFIRDKRVSVFEQEA